MAQNGQNGHFGQNDLIPNRILAFARPKWTKMVHFGLKIPNRILAFARPKWTKMVHFGLKRSILVHFGPPTVLWSLLIKAMVSASVDLETCFGRVGYPADRLHYTPNSKLKRQEKASAEIRGGIFPTKFLCEFCGGFFGGFFRAFFLGKNRRKKSTKKSTAKFKSEFGSFAAKIHTARIWP